jgi:hypothetical protein
MRVRGALHIHSALSHDGTLTIQELVQLYKGKGYQFLAMGEHAEDLDEAKVKWVREESARNSSETFCVIPGIEFAGNEGMHIVGLGAVRLIREMDPLGVIRGIHAQDGFAVLAHPKRIGWACAPEILQGVDAAEIWNVGYDGKYLPSPKALSAFVQMQQINPRLLAVASHDFHRTASFYDVAIEMDVTELSSNAILRNLQQGSYRIQSRWFRTDSKARVSRLKVAFTRHLSDQLAKVRRVRSFLLRLAQ